MLVYLIKGWRYLPTPTNRKVEKYFRILNENVYEMISKRRKERADSTITKRNILDLLIEAEDSEGEGRGFSDEEVKKFKFRNEKGS